MKKTGVVLLNLGTPDAPERKEVARYLREFLMDPYVINIPYLFRWILVNVVIATVRSGKSALNYKKIWTERGSPLKFHLEDLVQKVSKYLPEHFTVVPAMRYQNPSIFKALKTLKEKGVESLLIFPLYPQYSEATTRSSEEKVAECLRELKWDVPLRFVEPYYNEPRFIECFKNRIEKESKDKDFDVLLLSYHGLPIRQIKKNKTCYESSQCCEVITSKNSKCYKAHCTQTTKAIAQALSLPKEKVIQSFQSRVGVENWIQPYTQNKVLELRQSGVKKIIIACPAFTADCLETIEEIGMGIKKEFLSNGGESFKLIPSLNADDDWAKCVSETVQENVSNHLN